MRLREFKRTRCQNATGTDLYFVARDNALHKRPQKKPRCRGFFCRCARSALAELGRAAGFAQTNFLALDFARIARQKAVPTKIAAQLFVV